MEQILNGDKQIDNFEVKPVGEKKKVGSTINTDSNKITISPNLALVSWLEG